MHSRLKFDIGWGRLLWAAAGSRVSRPRLKTARAVVEGYWPDRRVVLGLSERTLFDALLSELALPKGSKVIMSAINIANMLEIARAHDLEVLPVDIDPATLSPPPGALLEAQARFDAKLCVVAQLYGAVTRIHDAAALRERGVFVIEDAAQAFAGGFHRGDENADVTLFSFGPIKRRTALGGGVGVFRDREIALRVEQRLAGHPPRSNTWLRQRAFKYVLLKACSAPLPYGLLMWALERMHRNVDETIGGAARGFSGPSLIEAIRGRLPDRMVALMARQIVTTEDGTTRVETCRAFLRLLPAGLAAVGARADRHAYWLLPIACADPDGMMAHLRGRGFDATRGTTSLRALDPGETPMASRLLANVVYLPHPAGLSDKQRTRLADAVSEAG